MLMLMIYLFGLIITMQLGKPMGNLSLSWNCLLIVFKIGVLSWYFISWIGHFQLKRSWWDSETIQLFCFFPFFQLLFNFLKNFDATAHFKNFNGIQPLLEHLNSELVWFSDPHCSLVSDWLKVVHWLNGPLSRPPIGKETFCLIFQMPFVIRTKCRVFHCFQPFKQMRH